MWRALLVVAAIGCGRIGFDPRGNGDGLSGPIAPRCGSEPTLVACFHFDDESFDHSGFANHASGTVRYASGVVGRAGEFDDTTDLRIADSASLDFANAVTVMAWVKLFTLPTGMRGVIVDRNVGYSVSVNAAGGPQIGISIFNATAGGAGGQQPLVLDTWTHVAATFDGTVAAVYVGGTFVDDNMLTGTIDNRDTLGTRIGGNLGDTMTSEDQPFLGRIDELGIWSEALPATRIACAASRSCP